MQAACLNQDKVPMASGYHTGQFSSRCATGNIIQSILCFALTTLGFCTPTSNHFLLGLTSVLQALSLRSLLPHAWAEHQQHRCHPRACLKCRIWSCRPDLLDQNLNFKNFSKWFVCIVKSQNYPGTLSPPLSAFDFHFSPPLLLGFPCPTTEPSAFAKYRWHGPSLLLFPGCRKPSVEISQMKWIMWLPFIEQLLWAGSVLSACHA